MMLREHRGSLNESMETAVEVSNTRSALYAHISPILRKFGFEFKPEALNVNLFHAFADNRIGWSTTYIVKIEGYGVFGFCNSTLVEERHER